VVDAYSIRTIEICGAQAAVVVLCTESMHHAYLISMVGDSSSDLGPRLTILNLEQ